MHQIGTKYTRHRAFQGEQEIQESYQPEDAEKHHVMSHTTRDFVNIYGFVRENHLDPAKKVCSDCYLFLKVTISFGN